MKFLPSPSGAALAAPGSKWSARRQLMIGFGTLILLVVCLGGWSVMANIAGAIVAPGMIEVEGNRQVVQHPDGGVVGQINVDDGDMVEAGSVLMRFDDTLLRSELAIIEGQLFELGARRGRLVAERDGALTISFDDELLLLAETRADVAELIDGQARLFAARALSRQGEQSQLRERLTQIENQIEGATAQLAALEEQLQLIETELADQQSLLDKGLAQASRVLALQRERAGLGGRVGELKASIAESRGRIAETEIEILRLDSALREEAITTLRDLQYREIELRERRISTLETLSRMDVRAPVAGVIYGKTVHALRSVVRAADPVMYIVPQDDNLVISSRIETIHIDQVRLGQPATLRFSAFDQRTTPELNGTVTKISADVLTDEVTGQNYYAAELLPDPGEIERLNGVTIVPGMPVDAFIKTGERTPLNYLLKPLTDYFSKAFRET